MKIKLVILGILIALAGKAQIKIDRQHFVDLLSQGKYGDVFREAQEIRKKEYGKCLMIDYFIAKALCGDGHTKEAVLKYSTILKNYKLSEKNRNFITSEKDGCKPGEGRNGSATLNVNIRDFSNIMAMNSPEASVRGKMGMISDCRMSPQELTYVTDVSTEELESRLFAVDKSEDAIRKYKSILNSNYHIGVSGRFLLITYGTTVLNSEQLAETSERLERTYNFFVSHFNLRPPDKLLTVYLLPDKNTFRQTARLIHGIKVPDANIGYSNISDLSLVGVSDITRIGTLCHEMFHLIVRTDIGDIPPWMDEGIACIYETSKWIGNELVGDFFNWRTDVLGGASFEMGNKIPHLREFIGYNWKQFDGFESNDLCKAYINYAYGKHLMLYLQEEGKLTTLFTAVKNRNEITQDPNTVFQTDGDLFEQTFLHNLDTIDGKFDQWMQKKYNIKLHWNKQQISQQNLPNVEQMVKQSPLKDEYLNAPNLSREASVGEEANKVLNSLSIHVKKDPKDKIGDAISFLYYVDGDSKILDDIEVVYYQRNHTTFPEFKNKSFVKSGSRANNFSFKGYQWGFIETVYVYVVLKDKSKSEVVLKIIVYDMQ